MKRVNAIEWDSTGLGDLPLDIVELIFALDQWHCCGPLARTGARWMRLITTPRLVHSLLKSLTGNILEGLPRWLFFALPATLIGDAPRFEWEEYVGDRKNMVFPMDLLGEQYFYTGGDVAKRLYQKEWQSDIDVWTTDTNLAVVEFSDDTLGERHDWDFVVKSEQLSEQIQRCIETFDLSVVQQGFVQRLQEEPEFYATPLAIYSLRYKKLLISVHPLCLDNYDSLLNATYLRAHVLIRNNVQKHAQGRHRQMDPALFHDDSVKVSPYLVSHFKLNHFFENCELCMATLMDSHDSRMGIQSSSKRVAQYLSGNNQCETLKPIIRWTKRVMKYRNRFPDYESLYVVNPFVEQQIQRLHEESDTAVKQKQSQCKQCRGMTVQLIADNEYGPCSECSTWKNYHENYLML